MCKTFIFLVLLAGIVSVHAQPSGDIHRLKAALQKEKDYLKRSHLLCDISGRYRRISMDSAKVYIERAETSMYHTDDLPLRVRVLKNAAIIYKIKGVYDLGLSKALRGLRIAERLRDSSEMAHFYAIMGGIYHYMEQYEQALACFDKEAAILERFPDERKKLRLIGDYGHIYRLTGKPALALEYYYRAIKMRENILQEPDEPCALIGDMGKAHSELGNYETALEYHLKSYRCLQRNQCAKIDGFSNVMINLADVMLKLDRPKDALEKALYGLRLARQFGNKLHIKEHLSNITEAYASMGNHKDAYKYSILYSRVKDSLLNGHSVGEITNLKIQHETEKHIQARQLAEQQLDIEELQQSSERRIWYFISCAFLAILLLVFTFARLRIYRNRLKSQDLEQRLLRVQMNPHFIFNELMAVKKYLYKNDIMSIDRYLFRIAHLMRSVLEGSRFEYISLQREMGSWESYLELQRLRLCNGFSFNIDLDPIIDQEQIFLPSMLVQPLLENAVEHGVASLESPVEGRVDVKVSCDSGLLCVEIENNGGYIDKDHREGEKVDSRHISMGTDIIRERLTLLRNKSNIKGELTIKRKHDVSGKVAGTRVLLTIPLLVSNTGTVRNPAA